MSVRLDHGDDSLGELHEINVTPFIDVILVLLIIFMVAAPLATVDIAVNLPASTAEPQPRPEKPIFLTVKPDLTLALGETTIPRDVLDGALAAVTKGEKDTRIFPACRQSRFVRRPDGGDEPHAQGRLSEDRACRAGEAAYSMTMMHDRRTLQRWLLSGAVVLMVHGGVAAAIVHWRDGDDDAAPSSAIVIDLAPTMMAPDDVQEAVPPGPEQVQADAAPEQKIEQLEDKVAEDKTEPQVEQEPQPDIAPAQNPEVVLAPKPPEPRPEPVPTESQTPAPVTTAPQVPKIEESPVATAPVQAQRSVSDSMAVPNWKRQVVARLERNKRYPAAARARNETGTAQLAFSLDRQGKVTAARIFKSSGSASLDAETLELVRRAQPFPAPPAAMAGVRIDLMVPVRFNVH